MKNLNFTYIIILTLLIACNGLPKSGKTITESEKESFKQNGYMGAYTINDNTYGTKTAVSIEGDKRIMVTNGLPNHETGVFPNPGNPNKISAQNLSYTFPLNPVSTGKPRWAREPGVALNGIKFEPETAEAFVCETGERYRIEAFQELVNLGLDSNHAHVQPTGAYHYHGAPTGLLKFLDDGKDIILIGFAHDGFPIYYSKSGVYKPSYKLALKSRTGDVCSYKTPKQSITKDLNGTSPDGTFVSDWEYVKGFGTLDECNGTTLNGKYAYFATDEYPYIGRCLMGEFTEKRPNGPPPGGRPPRGEGGRPPRN